MSMENAVNILATHLAKKAAKRKGTTSENYIEGYRDAIVFAAKNPLPPDAEMIAALDAAIDTMPGREPTPIPAEEPKE